MVTTTTCQAVIGFDSLRPLLQESPGQRARMRSTSGPAQLRSAGIEPHAGGSGMGRVSVADDEVAGYRLCGLVWPERSYPAAVCKIVPWRPASIYECPIACSPPGGAWHRPEKIEGIALYRPSKAMSAAAVALS